MLFANSEANAICFSSKHQNDKIKKVRVHEYSIISFTHTYHDQKSSTSNRRIKNQEWQEYFTRALKRKYHSK